MGLAAVLMGMLWRDAHLPLALAAALTLLVGLLGGWLNALMITRLKFPPLIVTLGTFSLFRGVAEGLTRGIDNYSGFPPSFLFLGHRTAPPTGLRMGNPSLPRLKCPRTNTSAWSQSAGNLPRRVRIAGGGIGKRKHDYAPPRTDCTAATMP